MGSVGVSTSTQTMSFFLPPSLKSLHCITTIIFTSFLLSQADQTDPLSSPVLSVRDSSVCHNR